jgi:hypothetical protein
MAVSLTPHQILIGFNWKAGMDRLHLPKLKHSYMKRIVKSRMEIGGMMNKVMLWSGFIVCLFGSCQPRKEKKSFLVHRDYEMNELFIGKGGYIVATGDSCIVGLDTAGDYFFYRQKVNQPEAFHLFGKRGQGPDEFIFPFSLQYLSDDLLGVYDAQTKQFSEVALNQPEHPETKRISFSLMMNFKVLKTQWNQYIGMGAYPDCMYMMFDSSGLQVKPFFEYPYKDSDEKHIGNPVRSMAYQGKMVANPSATRFAYASSYADIIHFYRISFGDIQLIQKIENRFCDYVPEEKNGGISAPIQSTNQNGCVDLYATEKYVYLLYSGKSFGEYQEKAFEGNEVRMYDWSGNLLGEMALDIPCKFFCVSPDDQTMWAIAEIPEPTIVRFELDR